MAPSAMQLSMAATWLSNVAVNLAGISLEVDAEFRGLGGRAFLHLDEERIGVGLGDQAGANVLRRCGRGESHQGDGSSAEHGRFQECGLGHDYPPSETETTPAQPASDEHPGTPVAWMSAITKHQFKGDVN